MSVPQPRFLETYNSLTDKHLAGYFNNARIRRHLQKSGLISRSGRIIPEKEYRLNAMRRDHQRYVQDCLAHAIFHKVLDMERHHQLEIKKSLEYSMRKERMEKIKAEQFRGSLEDDIPMHSPHPPLCPRGHNGLSPSVAGERAGRSQWRVPGLGVDCGGGNCPHWHRTKESTPKGERSGLRCMNSMEYVTGVSPYQLPVIKPFVVPVPPPRQPRGHRCGPAVRSELPTGRRFRPTTAFNELLLIKNTRGFPKSPLCSNASITMVYVGKSAHVSLSDYNEEIQVYQQHCGGENVCVFKGKVLEGDTFQFISKRHHGFPFSLTFYINGLQVDRLSCCCEYKQQRRSQLRAKHRYFRVLNVEGAYPCYRCILAMGLDKKKSPPKRKIKYHDEKDDVCSCGHAVYSEPSTVSTIEQKSRRSSVSVILPSHEASVKIIEETLETEEEYRKEEMENLCGLESKDCLESNDCLQGKDCLQRKDCLQSKDFLESKDGLESKDDLHSEDSQEDIRKNEYDEDFEADEEVNEEGQTGDQMNGMSESSSDDKNHNLVYEKESETSSQKALQASGSEKDESDGYSNRDSDDDQQKRRPADSLSSIGTQCSTEGESHAETMTDNVNGKGECDIKSTSDSTAHAHYGNENGEKKLLRTEESQETSTLEKKGIDEAEKTKPEDLTARGDTRTCHENIMAMQYPNLEVNGEFKQTGSGESNMNEEEERLPVPWECRVLNMEDGNESPQSEEGGVFEDCKPVQEERAKVTGNDLPVNSAPEPGDLCANEEEENAARTVCHASGAPDGNFLAGGRRSLDVQEAAGEAVQEGQRQALEQDGAAKGRDADSGEARGKAVRVGDLLPQADVGAALEESAPEEGSVAEEHPKGKGTGEAVKLGTEVSPGEQEGMESKVALEKPAPGGEGLAGALLGWEADAAVSQGQERAGGITEEEEEEEAAEEGLKGVVGPPAEEEVGEPVSQAGESLGEGGSAGKGAVVGAVSEGEEAVQDADVAAGEIAGVGPEGEEAVEEDVSEGEEAVGKPGALWEALEDMEMGEAMPGGEGFVKPNEFSQLKASGEEQREMGKAVAGAVGLESDQVWDMRRNALDRVENTVEVLVEPGKGPALEVSPGLGALQDARGDPVTEGSSQAEEMLAAQEKEGAAETLWSGNQSAGSKAETERAGEGKRDGEVVGGSAGAAGAGSGGEDEATGGAAGSGEPAAGTEEWLRRAKVTGKGSFPEAALPAPGLCVTRAGEPGLVAIAVLGGQAEPGALAGEPVLARGSVAAQSGEVGTGAMAQEGVTGAVLGAQSRTGAAVAEEVSARGRGAVGESGRHRQGVADGPVAGAREVSQEAAVGCEGRGSMPAGAEDQGGAEREWGAVHLVSPRHGEVLRTMSLREQATAETSPSTPARGDGVEPRGRGSPGGEGLCLGIQPHLAAAETGTARGKDGWQQEGMEQAGVKAGGEQPSPRGNAGESEVADVWASAGCAAGAGGQRKDSSGGGSPGVLRAIDGGDRSRSPCQDGVNPDLVIVSSEQPQDGEEILL